MSALDKTGLAPCPFCGGTNFTFRTQDDHHLNSVMTWHELRCDGCPARTRYPSKGGLIEAWNRRASTTSAGEAELEMIASEARRYASFYPTGFAAHNSFVDFAEWIERLSASTTSAGVTEEQVEAATYAENLARVLWEKHYKDAVPHWQPLSGDVVGLLTQIDNMTAGLYRAPSQGAGEIKPPKGWTSMPTYGEVSFSELVEAVAEAIYADRKHEWPIEKINLDKFIGHQIVPTINFNSLNRIVSAFVRAALEASRVAVSQKKAVAVAWRVRKGPGLEWSTVSNDPDRYIGFHGWEKQPLYASPAPAGEPEGIKALEWKESRADAAPSASAQGGNAE